MSFRGKYLKRNILDELYEEKSESFENSILKEMQKENKCEKSLLLEEELTNKIKTKVEDEELQKELLSKLNEFELELSNEADLWNKMYYKLGIYDCTELKNIIQNDIEKSSNQNKNVTFFDEYTDNFLDYMEINRKEILNNNTEYREIASQIEKIKVDNPNVRTFLEDGEAVELTDVELNAVLDILKLQGCIDNIELKSSFKLGAKEIIQFFRQVNLL